MSFAGKEAVINFRIKGSSDAHVLLAEKNCHSCEGYEIVIGAWSNSQTVISQQNPWQEYAVKTTPSILSPDEYRDFYISLKLEDEVCKTFIVFYFNYNF